MHGLACTNVRSLSVPVLINNVLNMLDEVD